MKHLLAALLFVLQLQPLLGPAACLADRVSRPECEMPEHGAIPSATLSQTELPAPNCVLASVCAPSPLAIVSLPENLESVIAPQSEPPVMVATTFPAVASAPPFHPPRA